jgi:hypothetical protein
VVPSASLTAAKLPPLSPLRSGWTKMVTWSPGFSVVRFQPSWTRLLGAVISIAQCSEPSGALTSASMKLCGFCHLNWVIVASSVTVLVMSNIA